MNYFSFKHIFATAAALFVAAAPALAVPAYPDVITTTQPDGSKVMLRQMGDEYGHWAVTPDGYTLLRDKQDFWTIATADDEGYARPSDIRYTGSTDIARARGIAPNLEYRMPQSAMELRARKSSLQIDNSFPTSGKRKLLMLLINYADTQTTFTQSDFNDFMNKEGYNGIGSFRDYYLENSYGKLDVTTTVTRWVTLPYAKSVYGDDVAEQVRQAMNQLDSEINLRDFDNDGDGILDGLAIIHQGLGQEYSGDYSDIWSHSGTIYGQTYDGVQIRRYTIEPERLGDEISTIGVMTHEFGHNLGAPDFYDTVNGSNVGYPGTGYWDLMGSGAWNGPSNRRGSRPAGTNMWQKIQLGWATPTELTTAQTISAMPAAHTSATAYKVNTTVPGEYFLLENRQQRGNFDFALPYHGLIIYHVDENLISERCIPNTLNTTHPQAMYVVCANSGYEPGSVIATYGNVNSSATPFPGSGNVTAFSDYTTPSAKSNSGRASYFSIKNITENTGGTITFTFDPGNTPEPPKNLTAIVKEGSVILNWEAPSAAAGNVSKYTVYRNGEVLTTTTATTYTDAYAPSDATIKYAVDATYTDGRVSTYAMVEISIIPNIVTAVKNTNTASSVTLDFTLNNTLSRCLSLVDADVYDYTVASADVAHRYRAEDIKVYEGYKIKKIAFLPYMGPQQLSATIRVWTSDPDGSNMELLAERTTQEFGTLTWSEVLLTKTVVIPADKDLWIGVHYTSNTGSLQLVTDKGPALNGYGNMVRIDGEAWKADTSIDANHFIYAVLTAVDSPYDATLANPGEVTDPAIDLALPIGFSVYRDGSYIGCTASRRFVDRAPSLGSHTYEVHCIYRGASESSGISHEVFFDGTGSGVDDINADAADDAPATYYDLRGARITTPAPGGIYIEQRGASATKTLK